MEYTDLKEVRMIFERFNKVRKCRGELAETEFVKWFNRKKKIVKKVFKEARISDTQVYDIDLIKHTGEVIKIEMKTTHGSGYGSIKMFDTSGIENKESMSYPEQLQHIKNRYKDVIVGKFDYLVYLIRNSNLRIFTNQEFFDEREKHNFNNSWQVLWHVRKEKKMLECEICGSDFLSSNYKAGSCQSESCLKVQKSIQSRRARVRKHIKNNGTLVVYPGRFQPACDHHKDVYNKLKAKYGTVIVITSGKQEGKRSPLNFADKRQLIHEKFNIPLGDIIKVNNPYKAEEIFKKVKLPMDSLQLIVALGEKDGSRLIGGKYYTKLKYRDKMKSASDKGYVHIVNNIMDGDQIASATSFRNQS